ncbi:MAG: hypothetical protein EP344_11215 [Bacteroidetes bacterium]|nr:MAG: hypothetical protein EP344_11215 [Bacteroidota bacterium]
MENTKLIQLLRTFSPEERKGLKKWVQSPFFNQRPEVYTLLVFLEKSMRSGKPAPDKQDAFRHIFGDKPFDDHRIRMTISFLYRQANQFLATTHFLADTPQYQLHLAGLLRQRRLDDQARQAQQASGTALNSYPYHNADFQQQQYLFLLEQYRGAVQQSPAGPLPLQALSDQLDRAFLSRKLWQACFMHSHQTVFNTRYDYGLLEAVLLHIPGSPAMEEPDIALYYHCYHALTNPQEKSHFQQFKQLLLRSNNHFPEEELRDLYILAINFCIRQYNAGNTEYLADQFDFYREGLDKRYFLADGELSRYTYQNAVTIGLVLNELDWVETFLHSYLPRLPQQNRESVFNFNLARLEYRRRRLGSALQLVQKADYKDLLLHLAAKTLQLKIFYEMEAFDLLESHLQALQIFIRRKKNLGYHRENYLNTVHFTRKLLESNLFDREIRQALRQEIEQTKALAEKEWLLEKLEKR